MIMNREGEMSEFSGIEKSTNNGNSNKSLFLTILCIAGFLSTAISLIYDLSLMSLSGISDGELKHLFETSMANMPAYDSKMISESFGVMRSMLDFAWVHLLFNFVELVALIMLICKRLIGLHVYIASQIGFSWVTYMVFGGGGIMIILFNALWVFLFYSAVKVYRSNSYMA